jgi:hypothetical protein
MSRSLGSLRIDLVALTGKFEANFRSATGTLEKFGVAATKIGRVATGAFGAIAKTVFSLRGALTGIVAAVGAAKLAASFQQASLAVADLGKKAATLGISVRDLSAFRFAAKESNVEFDTLVKMLGKASKNIATFVATGAGPAADELRRLGVNLTKNDGTLRSMAEILPEIAARFEQISDSGEKLRLAEGIFGRDGGQQFVQFLEDSGGFMANLAEQTERARRLGVLFTDEQVDRLKKYNDAVGRISEAWLGFRVRILTEFAPFLEEIANKVASFVAAIPRIFRRLSEAIGAYIRSVLTPEQERAINTIFESISRLVSIGVTSLLKLGFGLLVDGVKIAASMGFPILKLAANTLIVQPVATALDTLYGLAESLFQWLIDFEKKITTWARGVAADLIDVVSMLIDSMTTKIRDGLASGVSLAAAISPVAGEVARALSSRAEGTLSVLDQISASVRGISAAFRSVGIQDNPVLVWIRDAVKELRRSTSEGADEITRQLAETTKEDFERAISAATAGGFLSTKIFAEELAKIRPELAKLIPAVDSLLDISGAMKETAVDAESIRNAIVGVGKAIKSTVEDSSWEKFFIGMREAFKDLSDESKDFAKLGRETFAGFARSISGNLATALAKGEASFRNFGETVRNVVVDVVQNIAQMILQFYIMRAIVGAFGGFFDGPVASTAPGGGLPDFTGPSTPTFAAKGGVFGFARGGIASGVLGGPMAFPFSHKIGVAGEAGDEVGFAPLRRIGGELGVAATGGDVTVQVIDQRGSGARPEVSTTRGDDGKKTIRILIRDEVRRGIGEGEFDKVLGANFGLGRKGTKR